MPATSNTASRFLFDPRFVLLAGSLIALVALGMRHSFGLFLEPITGSLPDVDRESFGFAIALQNLVWGVAQPFAGMIADRFGSARVIFVGGMLYAGGLVCASAASTSLGLVLGFGVLVGVGLSATSYAVVLGAVGRRYPPERRTSALGIASLGGSLGIFLSVPVTLSLIDSLSWPTALVSLAFVAAVICVLAPFLSGRSVEPSADQTLKSALGEALSHRGFVLLVLGFFVCGFQLAFIGTHLPAYLLDRHLAPWLGGAALATIGATNIAGTFVCGVLGDILSKKKILVALYLARSGAVAVFVSLAPSDISTLLFAAVMGFTWLGTVPLTTGIVAQIFGARYLATLVGIVFLMHQIGSFLGAWLGGFVFEHTGNYDIMWWSVVASGVLAALIHLPINERSLAEERHVPGSALSNA
ncbi:MFS transporter [Labrenzia sp. DG1229]|uniref:MFS transporter n=1 Tax=Labrenzia sp. DG1229 TaxID=681847 RepID=UPI00068A3C6C|nr:MFS transporter [Labrenzia sp. DG1229]